MNGDKLLTTPLTTTDFSLRLRRHKRPRVLAVLCLEMMRAFTFLFYTAVTMPLVSFLIYPADPLKAFGNLGEAAAILTVSMYAGLIALLGVWLSTTRKWGLLRSGASIGVFVALALFPLYFLVFFLGGPIILGYMALLGKVHGMAVQGIYDINLKA